jgi:hypothetical protein
VRGVKFGGNRGVGFDLEARAQVTRRALYASMRAPTDLATAVEEIRAAVQCHCVTLRAALNERGIEAPPGGPWSTTQGGHRWRGLRRAHLSFWREVI